MAHCWQEYISKVHTAEPLDPWVTNVELLDIFIQKNRSWLPWQSAKRMRIGSILNLGDKAEAKQWKENVQDPITTDLQRLDSASATTSEVDNVKIFHEDKGMADMQASIKATSSLLASIFTGKSTETQFNAKGVNTVKCVVTGVKSRRVRLDVLMDLVNQRGVNEPAWWRPNTSRPEFRWSSKRGKTIWVVTEILYASNIRMDVDNDKSAGGTETVSAIAKVGEIQASTEVTTEKDGMWVVTATKQKAFPFAYRTVKLEYDADGSIRQTNKSTMKRSRSLTNIATKPGPSQHMAEQLHRSSSVSK